MVTKSVGYAGYKDKTRGNTMKKYFFKTGVFFAGLLIVMCTNAATKNQIAVKSRMYSGSLRANIIRLAHEYGWKQVVWTLPNDYRWVGDTVVDADTLPATLRVVLQNYPVQAQMYSGNHVLVIVPRTLRS